MQRLIDNEDQTDKMNNGLQVDVMSSREQNKGFKSQIGKTDHDRTQAIAELRVLQAERDRRASILDEIKQDLNRKHIMLKELEE